MFADRSKIFYISKEGEHMRYVVLKVLPVAAYCYGCGSQCQNKCGTQDISG